MLVTSGQTEGPVGRAPLALVWAPGWRRPWDELASFGSCSEDGNVCGKPTRKMKEKAPFTWTPTRC